MLDLLDIWFNESAPNLDAWLFENLRAGIDRLPAQLRLQLRGFKKPWKPFVPERFITDNELALLNRLMHPARKPLPCPFCDGKDHPVPMSKRWDTTEVFVPLDSRTSRGGIERYSCWSGQNRGLKCCQHESIGKTNGYFRCLHCDAALSLNTVKGLKKKSGASIERAVSTCVHPYLKTFTFSSGETIQSCPDCAEFDEKRWDVLGTNPPKYEGASEYVIDGAPSLHASQILSPDLSEFTRPARPEEQYNDSPLIVKAFKSQPLVYNTIYKMVLPHVKSPTRTREIARELTGDVWVKVLESISTFRNDSKIRTWVVSIAENTAKDWRRAFHAQKREGEVLMTDIIMPEDEDGELQEADYYPDAKQDQLVGIGSGTRRTFEYRDAFTAFTATKQVMQIDAAIENGEPASPVERRILRDWVLGNLREIHLHELHRLLPRKTSPMKVPEPFIMKKGQKWSPLKGWAPARTVFGVPWDVYLDVNEQLRKRVQRNTTKGVERRDWLKVRTDGNSPTGAVEQ